MSSRQRRSRAASRRVPAAARVLTGGSGLAVVGSLLSGSVAHAATNVTVQTLGGGQDKYAANTLYGSRETLADAIAYTNAHGGGTITFSSTLSGTIDLQEPLFIKQPTQIYGAHTPGQIKIDGATIPTHTSVFTVENAAGAGGGTELKGLTVTGGSSSSFGGAVYAGTGHLYLGDVVLTGNTATSGGAVADRYGTLRVEYSTLSGNSASSGGGAIFTQGDGLLTVGYSTLSGNSAGGKGGAVAAYEGTGSTAPTALIEDSTIYGNRAGYAGGVFLGPLIGASGAYLKAVADTIVGNSAKQIGGVALFAAPGTFLDTILAGNHATGSSPLADDLCLSYAGASATIRGSLLQSSVDTCSYRPTFVDSITGAGPELAPLANNGGLTETLMPEPGSPVIDRGVNVTAAPYGLNADQRGERRTIPLAGYPDPSWGNGTDIGAIEVQSNSVLAASVTGLSPSFGNAGQVVTIRGINLLNTRSVTFAGQAARILSNTQTELQVRAPAGTGGVAKVELTSPDGTVHTVPGGFDFPETTSRRRDNQRISVTTLPPNLRLPANGTAPLRFSSTAIRGSHAPRLRFRRALVFYDGGIRRVIHRIKRVHGHRHRVRVVVHNPDLTLRRKDETIAIPLSHLHAGINTIAVRVIYTERLERSHRHHRTRQVEATLTVRIDVA